jgi:hypothetical protein
MGKVEKAIIVMFVVIIGIFIAPVIFSLMGGSEAAWIMTPVLIAFLILFPIMVVIRKDG